MRVDNLDILVSAGHAGRYPVRVRAADASASGFADLDPKREGIAARLAQVDSRTASPEVLRQVGTWLFQWLFSSDPEQLKIRRVYTDARAKADARGAALRLQLVLDPPELAALPWELLWDPDLERFLGTWLRTPIVRRVQTVRTFGQPPRSSTFRILGVAPPISGLEVQREIDALTSAAASLGDKVRLDWVKPPVSLASIERELDAAPTHVLHFIGHGGFSEEQGALQLQDDVDGADVVPQASLAQALLNHEALRLVVLNACRGGQQSARRALSGVAPALAAQGIPAVVAMQHDIDNDVAIDFATEFYRELLTGRELGQIDLAVTAARSVLASKTDHGVAMATPVLFLSGPSGRLFEPAPARGRRALSIARRDVLEDRVAIAEHDLAARAEDLDQDDPQLLAAAAELRGHRAAVRRWKRNVLATGASAFVIPVVAWTGALDLIGPPAGRYAALSLGAVSHAAALAAWDRLASVVEPAPQPWEQLELVYFEEDELGDQTRDDLARLLSALATAQPPPRVVAVDLPLTGAKDGDQALVDSISALRQAGSLLVWAVDLDAAAPVEGEGDPTLAGTPLTAPAVAAGATSLGISCLPDALEEQYPVLSISMGFARPVEAEDPTWEVWPSLGLATWLALEGQDSTGPLVVHALEPELDLDLQGQTDPPPGRVGPPRWRAGEAPYCSLVGPGDLALHALLQPLDRATDPRARDRSLHHSDAERTPQRLADGVVVVGYEFDDQLIHACPGCEPLHRFEAHAALVAALHSGSLVRVPGLVSTLVTLPVLGALSSTVALWRGPPQEWIRPALAALLAGGWLALCATEYLEANTLHDTFEGLLCIALPYWGVAFVRRRLWT